MLRSLTQLCGHALGAMDGDIGTVKDFYFDDRHWAIRYLITDTGSWLSGRQVLISPHAFKTLDHAGKRLQVDLTRRQIEASPLIETHKPVSRQFEVDFYNYYGLNYYWQGIGIWGMSGYPVIEPPPGQTVGMPVEPVKPTGPPDDPHLRSTHAVTGYRIQASDGDLGHVSDFLIDDKSWVIEKLVIRTGGWFHHKDLLLPTSQVERISFETSTVLVKPSREAIRQGPEYLAA